jgi:hypothetical protein
VKGFLSCLVLCFVLAPAFAAPIVAPSRERSRIESRIRDIRTQVVEIDKELKLPNVKSDQYRALQNLRTNLEQERKVLEEQKKEFFDSDSPLIMYFDEAPPTATVAVPVKEPAKSLWETGGWVRFEGILPCAGCDGIKTELTLYNDGLRYTVKERYLGPGSPKRDFESEGLWTTLRGHGEDPDATVFELDYDKPGRERHFLRLSDDEIRLTDLDEKKLRKKVNLILKRTAP